MDLSQSLDFERLRFVEFEAKHRETLDLTEILDAERLRSAELEARLRSRDYGENEAGNEAQKINGNEAQALALAEERARALDEELEDARLRA